MNPSNTTRQPTSIHDPNTQIVKEEDYITFNKKKLTGETHNSTPVTPPVYDENTMVKYASKMGHKNAALSKAKYIKPKADKISQLLNPARENASSYIKPRNTYRNPVGALSDQNSSKTFISGHDYDKIETTEKLPNIIQDIDIPEKLSNTILKQSIER